MMNLFRKLFKIRYGSKVDTQSIRIKNGLLINNSAQME